MFLRLSADSTPFIVATMVKALTCASQSTPLSKTRHGSLFWCIGRVGTEGRVLMANAPFGHAQYSGFVGCVGCHSPHMGGRDIDIKGLAARL